MLRGSEMRPIKRENEIALQRVEMITIRMCGLHWFSCVASRQTLGTEDITTVAQWNWLRWYGQVLKKNLDWAKNAAYCRIYGLGRKSDLDPYARTRLLFLLTTFLSVSALSLGPLVFRLVFVLHVYSFGPSWRGLVAQWQGAGRAINKSGFDSLPLSSFRVQPCQSCSHTHTCLCHQAALIW